MNTAAASLASPTRDPFMPRRPPGMRVGLALALLAHALLIAGLAFSVDWHSTQPTAVEAELWSSLPQQAAPRAVEAPQPHSQPPVPRPAPAPPPRPQPVQPPTQPQVDPQIAIEKARQAKQAEADRELAEQADAARREKVRRDQARQTELVRQQAREQQARDQQAADKAESAEKAKAEKARADKEIANKEKADRTALAAQQAAARAAYLKRIQGLAGATGDSAATGTAAKSSGPSSSYAGRIMARVKPNIVYPDAIDGNPTASVEVRVAPDGTITSRRLLQGSGVKSWDDAVLRAIDRTDGLPRDIDGRVPPVIVIDFKPRS